MPLPLLHVIRPPPPPLKDVVSMYALIFPAGLTPTENQSKTIPGLSHSVRPLDTRFPLRSVLFSVQPSICSNTNISNEPKMEHSRIDCFYCFLLVLIKGRDAKALDLFWRIDYGHIILFLFNPT